MRRTRILISGLALTLLHAGVSAAAGGGGTSGFSGGGGGGGFSGGGGGGGGFSGGGGGFSGGGYSGGGGVAGSGAFGTLLLIVVGFWLGALLVGYVFRRMRYGAAAARDRWWAIRLRRRRAARVEEVRRVAAEAADEDAAFDADAVIARTRSLFAAVQKAWDERDRDALAQLAGPELMEEWRRRLGDFDRRGWHNRVRLLEEPRVEYVGLVNRADDADDRVVVRIECRVADFVKRRDGVRILREGARSTDVLLTEYWTLAKTGGEWRVQSIELGREGDHQLDGELVATPWGDRRRLRDEAVAERAEADALPAGASPATYADLDFDGPARSAAQDLALADGRFDPELIEGSVRRAVDAWTTAVDGPDDALEAVAHPAAVAALLHPGGPSSRVVVRRPRVETIQITGLDAAAEPPTVTVVVRARGGRYLEERDTAAVVAGSRDRETDFTEHWTLALDGAGEWPWRIADAGSPTAA